MNARRVVGVVGPFAIVLLLLVVLRLLAELSYAAQSEGTPEESSSDTIEGRAALPADTFAPGPPSGSKLDDEINGRALPFESQPVQGISAVIDDGEAGGSYWAMPDNGYGKKGNSADFLLRMYRIRPDFETGLGRRGEISVEEFIQLRDPDGRIPFSITNEDTEERHLTGADFDIESVRRDRSGDLWFGDEFGPFLLHTDATGRVLEAPFSLPDVKSPENPDLEAPETANLLSSKGFEGMAISEDGELLYPVLEGALKGDPDQRRHFIYEFDLQKKRYTGERWQYRTEDPEHGISDLTALRRDSQHRMLVIERSERAGGGAGFKKVYLVDLDSTDEEGFLIKREVIDLPDLGLPDIRAESILPLDERRLLMLNDNDYPFGVGDTEAIVVRLDDLPEEP